MGNREKIESIIENSLRTQQGQKREFYLFGNLVYIQEPIFGEFDVQSVIDFLEDNIPAHLFNEIDTIMIGSFDFLDARELEAAYRDGAIYISNRIQTKRDLLENVLHELSHSLEESLGYFIYGNARLMNEFLSKRRALERILQSHNIGTDNLDFSDTEYNKDFDVFLYKQVGYPKLRTLTTGLFHTPYAITSLQEYWASGFEHYFLGSRADLREVSPYLHDRIEGVISYED